jgi:hypothetical protein
MSSPGADAVLPFAVGGVEVRVRLALPEGASPEPTGDLPAVDVANLPGASVPLRAGYRTGAITLRVACATAPSTGWAPGVEDLVLGRASQIARGALGGNVERFEPGDVLPAGRRFDQRFEATVRPGGQGERLAARGRHVLGFVGGERHGVLCTFTCTEPAAPGSGDCDALVGAAEVEGAWVAAPPPSLLARGILLVAEGPWEAAGVLGLAAFALAALILARRPRPRA